jgi:catechol 2,3-dioxygenase-like lactoylglutathione lyase family enzyme
LGVESLERAVDFYADGLGFPTQEDSSIEDGIVFFELNANLRLSLYPREELAEDVGISAHGEGFSGITIAHNVRRREEVDEVIACAAEAGAEIVKQPEEASWGGYSGYFADPDGHLWEVAWNPYDSLAAE